MAKKEGQYEVNIVWPKDVHADARIANYFTFTDDGQGVYLAFGHVPPLPVVPEGVTEVTPAVRSTIFLTHQNALQLAGMLKAYAEVKDQASPEGEG